MSRINKYRNTIHLSDNVEFLRVLPSNSIDSIITDSPYGLGKEPDPKNCIYDWIVQGYHEVTGTGFMGKKWDAFVPQPILWKECYRILKPGGYLLSFFGTRTYDWGTLAIRWAGFEIRDCIQWIYGSGFPKSKSHLKPANEPICVARKPGPMRELNIDECRIPMAVGDTKGEFGPRILENCVNPKTKGIYGNFAGQNDVDNTIGRWPANVILDEASAFVLDNQTGILGTHNGVKKFNINGVKRNVYQNHSTCTEEWVGAGGDKGGASRFFYVAKASPSERKGNPHPTVKPVKLMQQLVKLYTPKGGILLDPHAGSGTTLVACDGWCDYIGIDNDEFSYNIAKNRLNKDNHEA